MPTSLAPTLETVFGLSPRIGEDAFIHHSAVLMGDVRVGDRASIWPGCVLRGDQGAIEIGEETSIQDGTIAHATIDVSSTIIGPRVTVGHRVVLHGCRVEADCLIGMGAILMDNCHIEPWCIIGAGALVPVNRRIPARSLVMGVPGRVVRQVTDAEIDTIIRYAHEEYQRLAVAHRIALKENNRE